jgi:hypothetical protein
MSEEETMPTETAESAEAEESQAPALGVNDLKLMANIIEVVSNRGAIKANEMAAVGSLYNNLMNFLISNGAIQAEAPEVGDEEVAETGEKGND